VSAPALLANLAAEEGSGWRQRRGEPAVARLAACWEASFDPPAFAWLAADPEEGFAWLVTSEAERWAREQGIRLRGAPAWVVARVHDKAFALDVSQRLGLGPAALLGVLRSFEPAQLGDAAAIEAALAAWPAWAQQAFTLKPRFGTSGRGRVAGRGGRVDAALRAALPRLAARGGAVLQPWLERTADWSTQLYVGEEGQLLLLGTLEQIVTPAGVVRGHRGCLDNRGRIRAGGPCDEALPEAAVALAREAAACGYHGPCGVDALSFRGPEGQQQGWPGVAEDQQQLWPSVELNARFTSGTVVLAVLRRALPRLTAALGLAPGERVGFFSALAAPRGGWPASGASGIFLPLGPGHLPEPPGIFVSRDAAALDRLVAASR